MLAQPPAEINGFNQQVIRLLELGELLSFALPALQSFLEQSFRTQVNLRLGLIESAAVPVIIPRQGRASSFGSTLPGWNDSSYLLDGNSLSGQAFKSRQPVYANLTSSEPMVVDHSVLADCLAFPLLTHSDNQTQAILEVQLQSSASVTLDRTWLESLTVFSTALANARRYDHAQQTIRQLATEQARIQPRSQELEAVFAGLNQGMMLLRMVDNHYYIQINPEGLRLFGWSDYQPAPSELADPLAYKFYRPESTGPHTESEPGGELLPLEQWPSYRALRGERFSELELLLVGRDRLRRHLSFTGTPLFDLQGQVSQAVLVFHDVTALRAVEEMKEGFLSLVSHDLRAPLAAISAYVEQAQYNLNLGDPQALSRVSRSLEVINRQSDRLNRLVNELLDMARLESGRMQLDLHPYNLALLVREVCNNLLETLPNLSFNQSDPDHPERPYLRLEIDRNLPRVVLDQLRFDQVLTNLLSNAVKYSDRGGEIVITLAVSQQDPALAHLSVQDQGIGIEPEKLPRLFSRFYRTEQVKSSGYSGTGLGLYICRLMVEALNGHIYAESQGLSQGATFHILLPFAQS